MEKIADIMSSDVHAISADISLQEAAEYMRDGDFGVLPVVENENLMGILTDRDIVIRGVAEGINTETRVEDIMSSEVVCVHEDDTLEEAAELMSEHQIRRLPVVDANQRLVGIVSLGDFAIQSSDLSPVVEALSGISNPT